MAPQIKPLGMVASFELDLREDDRRSLVLGV